MVSELERDLGIEIPSTLMFDHPTTAAITSEICSLIQQQRRDGNGEPCFEPNPTVQLSSALKLPELEDKSGTCLSCVITAVLNPQTRFQADCQTPTLFLVCDKCCAARPVGLLGHYVQFPSGQELSSDFKDCTMPIPRSRWDSEIDRGQDIITALRYAA